MKDWLHDNDRELALKLGLPIERWQTARRILVEQRLLRPEVHPIEGPILRLTHPEHLAAVGMLLGPAPHRQRPAR